jgi:NADH:ubiquinone oxidoreductase subunit 3 (subunit A)
MTPHVDIVEPYLFLVVFIAVAVVFPLLPLGLAWAWHRFFQPAKPGKWKNATYECGVESAGPARVQFKARYHLYCIIFLIFDVEAVFLIPFAAAFTGLSLGASIAILVFLLLLVEGLVWAWSNGCLSWGN